MSQPNSLYLLVRWLTLSAVVEWLINRSLTRFAIFIPKSGLVLAFYQILTLVGQFAFTLTGLLALVAVGWLAWQGRKAWRGALSLVLLALLVSSLIFVVVQPRDWLVVGSHLLMLTALALFARQLPRAFLFPAAGLFLGELYQLSAALGNALHLPGPVPFASPFFNLGELVVALSPFALWFASARGRASLSIWLLAAILPLSFAAFYHVQPAMAGIMAIWSMGLTLYLPWPLYAVSLWLAGVTLGAGLRHDNRVGWAILLLAAGGYAPQISTYAFLGLVALWLLSEESAPRVQPVASRPFQPLSKQHELETLELYPGLPPAIQSPHHGEAWRRMSGIQNKSEKSNSACTVTEWIPAPSLAPTHLALPGALSSPRRTSPNPRF